MSTMSIPTRITPGINPVATRPSGGVRLTRRGRVVVFVATLLVVLAAALFLGASSVATQDSGTTPRTERVVVGPGDTLWDIAASTAPDADVRETVHQIREINALDSSTVQAGQELFVPID